jgi:AcrR family transcriptional regulator
VRLRCRRVPEARDRKILDAAAVLFFERGYVGVDEIGVQAAITGPAVYRHFHGKDEILAALFDQAIDGILRATGGRFEDAREELEFRIRAHAEYVINEQALASVWMREDRSLSNAHHRGLHRREVQYVEGWIDCVKRAFPTLDGRTVSRAALLALGSLNAVVLWPAKPSTGQHLLDSITTFVLGGLTRTVDAAAG